MSDERPYDPPNLGGKSNWDKERMAKIPLYKDQIVEMLAEGVFPSEIAEMLDMNRRTISNWREIDKEFHERCTDAEEAYVDKAEKELRIRALLGTEEVILDPRTRQVVMDARHRDPTTGISTTPLVLRKKNDSTLQFFLRHNRPEKYGERRTIDSNVSFDSETVANEARAKIQEMIDRSGMGDK